MRNLKVWQKLVLMGAVFMAPFAVVTYKMTSSINALGVESARSEVQGLAFYPPVLALMKDLQLHRDTANAWLNGGASFQGALATKRNEVDRDIKALDEVDRRLGSVLRTTERWTEIRAATVDLLGKTSSLSPEQSFASHSKLIADVIAMMGDVSRQSNLALDADVSRKLLIDVLVLQGPELSEALARGRGIGVAAGSAAKRRPEQVESLRRDAILVEFLGAKMDGSLGEALASNETIRTQLETHSQATSDAVLAAMAEVVTLARADGTGKSPAEFFAAVTSGVESIDELDAHIIAALNASLASRISALRWEVTQTLLWAVAGLVVVSIVGFIIMRDVTVTLAQVVGIANRIALGDLTMPLSSKVRKDEIGVLARAFDRMVSALKETVHMAERIAGGDLAVMVTPRSDRDVMGQALANMVAQLSSLVNEVQKSGIQVNTSVNQIAATAKQQQATTSEIAATTTEIRATSTEISHTSNELVKTMNEVSSLAEDSATLANRGQEGVVRMEATMNEIIEAATVIYGKLTVLNDKARGITKVVTTITKVADQTNLLSLNAAIEAEKAGEYGRGFAVVATEIRRLADQTGVATFDIAQMVKEIQSAITAGVTEMDRFSEQVRRGMNEVQQVGEQLSQIINQVQALAPKFQEVNEGMHAQANGAQQITEALAHLAEAVQQTVESLRESNDIINGLNHAATGMRSGVARFKTAA